MGCISQEYYASYPCAFLWHNCGERFYPGLHLLIAKSV
jgi:hypothetical protein